MKKQLVDDLYIESIKKIKPDNKIQNTEKLTIFKSWKPKNIIKMKYNRDILKTPKPENIIESNNIIFIQKKENEHF